MQNREFQQSYRAYIDAIRRMREKNYEEQLRRRNEFIKNGYRRDYERSKWYFIIFVG